MAKRNLMEHNGIGDGTMVHRIRRSAYDFSTAAENIAAGQHDVAHVMRSWINSEGHYKNLVNPDVTQLGVGIAFNPRSAYGVFWVRSLCPVCVCVADGVR